MVYSSLLTVIILLCLLIIAWFWHDAMRGRELAISISRNFCQQHNWQFLDDAVICKGISVKRDNSGYLRLCRVYQFEYYNEEEKRKINVISICGGEIISIGAQSQNNIIELKYFKKSE